MQGQGARRVLQLGAVALAAILFAMQAFVGHHHDEEQTRPAPCAVCVVTAYSPGEIAEPIVAPPVTVHTAPLRDGVVVIAAFEALPPLRGRAPPAAAHHTQA